MNHKHTIYLLEWYYRELPILLDNAQHELLRLRADMEGASYTGVGVADYRLRETHGDSGQPGDPTHRAAIVVGKMSEDEQYLSREIGEYEEIGRLISSALRLIRPDVLQVIEGRYRDGKTLGDVANRDPSTIRYHQDFALGKIEQFFDIRLRAKGFPFCAKNYPELFADYTRKIRRIRGSMVA